MGRDFVAKFNITISTPNHTWPVEEGLDQPQDIRSA